MKTSTKLLSASILGLGLGLAAQPASAVEGGGLFVEPMLTYEMGGGKIDWPTPFENSDGDINGVGLGARIGFHVMDTLFVAGDLRYSRPGFKDASNDIDSSAAAYNFGATVGAQTPVVGLRVWGSLLLGSGLDPDKSNNVDFKFTGGNGYRVGVGFYVAVVSVNLEFQHLNYNTTVEEFGPFDVNQSFDDSDLTDNAYILSVSFPISL